MDVKDSNSWGGNSDSDMDDPLQLPSEDPNQPDKPLVETEFCVDDISSSGSGDEGGTSPKKLGLTPDCPG